MIFSKSFLLIMLRVLIIVALSVSMVYTYLSTELSITPVMFGVLILIAAIELSWHLKRQERNWSNFLHSMEFGDFNRAYQKRTQSKELQVAFDLITSQMEALKTNREAEFRLLQTVLRHVSVAVICYKEEGDVLFTNKAFNELLDLPALIHIDKLRERYPALHQVMRSEGNAPSGWIDHDQGQQLFVKTESFKLKGEAHRLASLTDIRNSLDAKELESYQKLMRVMTHEIMNSTTPVLSLIRVVNQKLIQGEALAQLSEKDQKNTGISLKAIEERTAGMLKFVEAYKQINKPIKPQPEPVESGSLLESVRSLMDQQEGASFSVTDEVNGPIMLDRSLMSQVLINLVKNALDAVSKVESPRVSISASQTADKYYLTVADNGPGVSEKAAQEIFVPFFTTKTEGSGIGLALSRKIVRAHGGMLEYERKGSTTKFIITLPG